MLGKTKGIVIRTTKYSDTSIIVKMYTDEYGLQSYISRTLRGKKSKSTASLFQPLAMVNIQVKKSNKSDLHRISEINLLHPYAHIPYDVIKSSIAIFLNEILFRSLQEEHHDRKLFEFIENSLLVLDLKEGNCSNFHVFFMLQLSRYLGFYPQGAYSTENVIFDLQEGRYVNAEPIHPYYLNMELSLILQRFLIAKYDTIDTIVLSKSQRKELLNGLILFYQLHISSFKEIKSQAVLQEVIE